MQKVINTLAIASFAVSAAVVGAGAYVYLNQDAIKARIGDEIGGLIGDAVGGAVGDLPGLVGGGPAAGGGGIPAPSSPAGIGIPSPF